MEDLRNPCFLIGSLVAAHSKVCILCLCGEMCQCLCWLNCLFTYLAFRKKKDSGYSHFQA